MADIYDFFNRKHFKKLAQDFYDVNTQVIETRGKYIGVLTKKQTKILRDTMRMMNIKKGQIENLMNEFQQLCCRASANGGCYDRVFRGS